MILFYKITGRVKTLPYRVGTLSNNFSVYGHATAEAFRCSTYDFRRCLPMKVLFINSVYVTGSTGRIVTDLAAMLNSQVDTAKVCFGF